MPIRDPDGVYDEDRIALVRGALEDFARVTGGTGVCVDEVVVQEEIEDEDAGAVGGTWDRRGRVTLAGSANLPYVVHHELCHAWDQGHGRPGDKEDVFDIEGTETRKDRAEVLATVCGIAVMEPAGLYADHLQQCGNPYAAPLIWTMENIRLDGGAGWRPERVAGAIDTFPLSELAGDAEVLGLAAAGPSLWVLAATDDAETLLAFDAQGLALRAAFDLPTLGEARSPAVLVDGRPEPVLVFGARGQRVRVRLDPETGAPRDAVHVDEQFDPLLSSAVARSGDLLTLFGLGEEDIVLDVATPDGEGDRSVTTAPAPGTLEGFLPSAAVLPDGRLAVGLRVHEAHRRIGRYAPGTNTWTSTRLPHTTEAERIVSMGAGHLAMTTEWAVDWMDEDASVAVLGADGGWFVPEGCEPPVRDAVHQILATDAAVWLLESPWGEEPRLVRVAMPGLD